MDLLTFELSKCYDCSHSTFLWPLICISGAEEWRFILQLILYLGNGSLTKQSLLWARIPAFPKIDLLFFNSGSLLTLHHSTDLSFCYMFIFVSLWIIVISFALHLLIICNTMEASSTQSNYSRCTVRNNSPLGHNKVYGFQSLKLSNMIAHERWVCVPSVSEDICEQYLCIPHLGFWHSCPHYLGAFLLMLLTA